VKSGDKVALFHLLSHKFLGLFFDPEDAGDIVPPKCWLTFNALHIFQKTELFT
jgi:hypothetical protein